MTRLEPRPLSDDFVSTQPGGGVGYRLETAWGRVRRKLLRWHWPRYLEHMAACRQGSDEGAPHPILDPRDLKYCRNRCTAHWLASDDPFRWRKTLPFARWGLCELQLFAWPLLASTVGIAAWNLYAAIVPLIVLLFVISFFRDPPRQIPQAPGAIVAPADGRIVEVCEVPHDPFLDGPAVRIGIFLSIFNVHINRAPAECRVIELRYRRGAFGNALWAESAERNENVWIGLEEEAWPHRRLVVRQIAGAIARRIVCDLRPGEVIDRGAKIGMIKFGSRTELILPQSPELQVLVLPGTKVRAGSSLVARFEVSPHSPQAS